MNIDLINRIIFLRTIIAYLGEKNQKNWWDTSFINKTAFTFLEINFPRTYYQAGIISAWEAAKKIHDERVGKIGTYHLFRLSPSIELMVVQTLKSYNFENIILKMTDYNSTQKLLEFDSDLTVELKEGPVNVSNNFKSKSSLEKVAGYYLKAFQNNINVFPYFSGTSNA